MKVIKGNIWDYWQKGYVIVIPTNRTIKKDGSLVMGKGLAYQCKNKFENIEYQWGAQITQSCEIIPQIFYDARRLIYFPVKYNWWEKADLDLIRHSIIELKSLLIEGIVEKIAIPKVGCGNGQLNWKEVEPILDKYLNDRFIVVDLK